MQRIIITENDANQRVDKFLTKTFYPKIFIYFLHFDKTNKILHFIFS